MNDLFRSLRTRPRTLCLLLATVGLLVGLGHHAVAQPSDPESLRQHVLACQTAVSEGEASSRQAAAAADQFDLEVLKRQQQLLTAKRQGGDVSRAQSELELSRDKHRLAQVKADGAELRLALSQGRLKSVQLQLQRLDVAQGASAEAQLADIDSRLSSLAAEGVITERRCREADSMAAQMAAELESKWGSRFTGKKPVAPPIYQATPDKDTAPEPEEATEL